MAANGVAYCHPDARQGILPRLLNEILTTRIMVPPPTILDGQAPWLWDCMAFARHG